MRIFLLAKFDNRTCTFLKICSGTAKITSSFGENRSLFSRKQTRETRQQSIKPRQINLNQCGMDIFIHFTLKIFEKVLNQTLLLLRKHDK